MPAVDLSLGQIADRGHEAGVELGEDPPWGQPVTDLPSFKAIRRTDLRRLGMTEATYGWGWTIELIVKAARRKLRIREIPLAYRSRIGGESKVSGNPIASIKAAFAILGVLLRHTVGRGARIDGRKQLLEET